MAHRKELHKRSVAARPAGVCLVWALVAWVLSAIPAAAHDAGLSVANLVVTDSLLRAELQFANADIAPLITALTDLHLLGDSAIEASCDDKPVPAQETKSRLGSSGEVLFQMSFALPRCTRLHVKSTILNRLPQGHRQYVSLRDSHGNVVVEQILERSSNVLDSDLTNNLVHSALQTSKQFLTLGIEHIFTGYDHLLFLIGLLVTGWSARAVAKVITSFTVAHSLTLALSATGVIQLTSRIVEPLIAVSIIYVGLENILRREPKGRSLLTFGFGLIHGLGFASALRETGVSSLTGGVALPLVSFNAGVEIAQIAIAALLLPLIWKLKPQPRFAGAYFPACCALIVLMGTYWFVQRIW